MRLISETKLQLGPDLNSGSSPVPVEFGLAPVPVDLAGTACCIIGFMMSYLHHVPLQFPGWITCTSPVPRLYHVLPSSSQTASRALLQFPGCITCSPPVPRMYHVLTSSSQNVSPPTFGDTWRGKLSLFSPFVTLIDFTLNTDISA